ncbi:transposase [Streptomyces mirabilis]|uniref:transposase n=1 Tax=Streptomyces mirabilis TaxID=68239 RepID=UPI003663D2D2
MLATVRDLNWLELAGQTLRAALETLACTTPDWLAGAVPIRKWAATQRDTKAIVIKSDKETCRPCLVRDQSTRSKTGGRTLFLQPRELQQVLDHARLQQGDEQWRAKYGSRAGIEGTIHRAVAATGMRRARSLGLQKSHLEHVFSRRCLPRERRSGRT